MCVKINASYVSVNFKKRRLETHKKIYTPVILDKTTFFCWLMFIFLMGDTLSYWIGSAFYSATFVIVQIQRGNRIPSSPINILCNLCLNCIVFSFRLVLVSFFSTIQLVCLEYWIHFAIYFFLWNCIIYRVLFDVSWLFCSLYLKDVKIVAKTNTLKYKSLMVGIGVMSVPKEKKPNSRTTQHTTHINYTKTGFIISTSNFSHSTWPTIHPIFSEVRLNTDAFTFSTFHS